MYNPWNTEFYIESKIVMSFPVLELIYFFIF